MHLWSSLLLYHNRPLFFSILIGSYTLMMLTFYPSLDNNYVHWGLILYLCKSGLLGLHGTVCVWMNAQNVTCLPSVEFIILTVLYSFPPYTVLIITVKVNRSYCNNSWFFRHCLTYSPSSSETKYSTSKCLFLQSSWIFNEASTVQFMIGCC